MTMSGWPLILLGLAAAGVFVTLIIGALMRTARREGSEKQRAETQQEILNDVELAKQARERLRTDPEYQRRVRDKYTRQ